MDAINGISTEFKSDVTEQKPHTKHGKKYGNCKRWNKNLVLKLKNPTFV